VSSPAPYRRAREPQMGGRIVAVSDQPTLPGRRLAERLRDLREQERLTQKQLARAIGGNDALSIATVSLWEKPGSDRLPPPPRLAAYARLFCTSRSFASGAPCLLHDGELTQEERDRQKELYAELLALRERAQSANPAPPSRVQPALDHPSIAQYASIWHFPDGEAVSIICSDAPEPPTYADPSDLNYSRYARYSDLDALIEVFGQVRADNPTSMIRILSTEELRYDFALNHLIIIGGAAVIDTAPYFAQDIPLPVAVPIPDTETHIFKCCVGEESREFASVRDDGSLVQDVGLVARGPHPHIPDRTVTVISGITSRGIHGAALSFTDQHVRDANEHYLEETFGSAGAFCTLMCVPVRNGAALPPNLWRDDVRLYEWSAKTGARW
jgi:transcriptional regulator with XRE-family HTH domain